MTPQLSHILVLDVIGRARASQDVLRRSQAILFELLSSCESFIVAQQVGETVTIYEESRLVVLFLADLIAPVRSALELWELVQELPSMSIRVGIHSGPVSVEANSLGRLIAFGEAMEEVRSLVETGKEGDILLSQSYAKSLGHIEEFASQIKEDDASSDKRYRIEPQKLVLLDAEGGNLEGLREELETALVTDGHETFSPSRGKVNLAWAKSVEDKIRSADTVVALVSDTDANNDFLQFQLEVAADEQRKRGRPMILPVRLNSGGISGTSTLAPSANTPGDTKNSRLISEVLSALASGIQETEPEPLSTAGGAVAATSKFYITRPADAEFEEALAKRESIILVKGPRQIGKTSLIASGIETVYRLGWRSVSTDFQKLSTRQLNSETEFYRVLAMSLCRELGFAYDFDSEWVDAFGPNMNMDGFMRSLIGDSELPLVWFIDEADRLFTAPFASDFFGLIRSWHNARATDRRGNWRRLTIVIGYATDAHLFIKDLNQSPFNVGFTVPMTMFTLENTLELNERYGAPIKREEDVQALQDLLGGQPFLTRRALDVLVQRKMDFETLMATAHRDDGPFGDHLKRVLVSVSQLPFVWDALRTSFEATAFPDSDGLHRLVAAGILVRNSNGGYDLPSELYMRYLARFVYQDWEPNRE